MEPLRVGIIGCGRTRTSGQATGAGISHRHAEGYKASSDVRIVALADIVLENAQAFQEMHGGDRLYTDYHEMLAKECLDIVSICVWPHLHAPMAIDCAQARVPAIHCEKPMAPTLGEARRMVAAAKEYEVQLTINHQRRFGSPFRKAKELLDSGAIGELVRLEASCSNMYDWGTHWFDMLFTTMIRHPLNGCWRRWIPAADASTLGYLWKGRNQSVWLRKRCHWLAGDRRIHAGSRKPADWQQRRHRGRGQSRGSLRMRTDDSGWQDIPVADGIHDNAFQPGDPGYRRCAQGEERAGALCTQSAHDGRADLCHLRVQPAPGTGGVAAGY